MERKVMSQEEADYEWYMFYQDIHRMKFMDHFVLAMSILISRKQNPRKNSETSLEPM